MTDKQRRGVLRFKIDDEVINILTQMSFDHLVWLCFCENLSDLETAIVRAMEWIGDAYGDLSPAGAFSKYWFAIEALVSTRSEGVTEYLVRSIPTLLTHGGFGFISEEEIPRIAKHVSQLYDLRCGAVHKGERNFSITDLADVRKYACLVLISYLALWRLGYSSHKEINAETDMLFLRSHKYVAVSKAIRFHRSTCKWVKRSARKSLITFSSKRVAMEKGFEPCKICIGNS